MRPTRTPRTTPPTTALLASAAALCLVALAGCSSGGHDAARSHPSSTHSGSSPSSRSASATASASPTATKPVLPAAAKEHTAAGAEAFVRFYFETLNYGFHTGDSAALEQYSLPDCPTCATWTEDIDKVTAAGNHVVGGSLQVKSIGAPPPNDVGSAVTVTLNYTEESLVDSAGRILATHPAHAVGAATFYAQWTGDGWRTASVHRGVQ